MSSYLNNFRWKIAAMAVAAIAIAAPTGLANAAPRLHPANNHGADGNLHAVAMRSAEIWRRVTVRNRFFPYARRWHLGKSSEIGFGPRPTGQYRSYERLDRFPGNAAN